MVQKFFDRLDNYEKKITQRLTSEEKREKKYKKIIWTTTLSIIALCIVVVLTIIYFDLILLTCNKIFIWITKQLK